MFVRRTSTRSRHGGEPYFTHRLVRSERVGGRVKQITLLNLGRHFDLPAELWPQFCARLSELLAPQGLLVAVEVPILVEAVAQRYAAQLRPRGEAPPAQQIATPVAERPHTTSPRITAEPTQVMIDADSLELLDLRSVGVESLALHAIAELGIADTLRQAGFNRVSLAAAVGQIVARMAQPASELATHAWLQQRSALGELWGFDFQRLSLKRLYSVADALLRQHDHVETQVYRHLSQSLGLHGTLALYDLTNTYFEGLAAGNPSAKRGHSKEKRSDAPLLTLALVLDDDGFVRRSQVFAGNVGERATLAKMLDGLGAAPGALVILDRGIVSEANLAWLREHGYRYLVMSRERLEIATPQTLITADDAPIQWQRIEDSADGDLRLACRSPDRALKERAMTTLQRTRFEAKLDALAAGLALPRHSKRADHIQQRIGRLKQAHASVAQHYQIDVDVDDSGQIATAIRYQYSPRGSSKAALPGHYVLRSNATELDGETLWRTYIQLTDVESAFRSLKSELGLRPIYHRLEKRSEAHLWISVLAYQCVQFLRRKLKAAGIHASWHTIRQTLADQHRITVTFNTKDGGTLHVRKASTPNADAAAIYDALGLNHKPGAITKRLFRSERDL